MKSAQCSQYTLFFTLFMLISVSFAYAQKGTQQSVFQAKSINDVSKKILEKRFKKHEVFEIPTSELSRFVQQESTPEFELKLGENHSWKMTLFENKLHTEDYVTRILTENGIVTEARQANTVFKGYLNDNPDHEIRMTIADGFMFGFVRDNEYQYYIEPLQHHDKKSNSDHFILYKLRDVIPDEDARCGVKDVQNKVAEIHENKSATLACVEVELAQAADYGMYQRYGSSVLNLNLYMDGIMNAAFTHFDNEFADQITLLISERYVVTCDGCDPWTDDLDGEVILNDFGNWGDGSSGFSTNPDLTNLWTTRDFSFEGSSNTVGLAWVGAVCASPNSSLFEDFNTTMALMVNLATHELGHNFGCFHNYESGDACDGNLGRGPLIMDPFVSFATMWSDGTEPCTLTGGSVTSVNNHVATRNCLSNCSLSATCANTKIDSFDIIGTSSGSIDIEWNDLASNYQVRARLSGSFSWTYINTTSNTSETITGLLCNTAYDVQVRTDCGGGVYGYPTTAVVQTTGLSIQQVTPINCSGGFYDLQIIIDTGGASAGTTFDVIVDGNVITQTFTGINPQSILISGLIADGSTGIIVEVDDGSCLQSDTFDAPQFISTLDVGLCESDDITNYNLNQLNTIVNGGTGSTVTWYDGQPSMGGTDITANASSYDLSTMPDIWAIVTDNVNCAQEVDINYAIDTSPVLTCPSNIIIDNVSDTCGATINIPLTTVMDDNLTPLATVQQNIQLDFNGPGVLIFDFDATDIDPTQPLTFFAYTTGNLSGNFIQISDEINPITLFSLSDCATGTDGFTYAPVNIAPQLTDGVLTFTADIFGTSGAVCAENYIGITLTYTPLSNQFVNITNDYNNGGADASDFYPPGTTTVSYIAIDGCGNTDTCSVDITVNQDLPQGEDFFFTACGDLMNFDLSQLNGNFGGTMGTPTTDWYDGQPSGGGLSLDPPVVDLTSMPDIWVLVNDIGSACLEEINVLYDLDFPPVLTCPTDISVSSDPGVCGATLTIPPLIVMDDSITSLPQEQIIFMPHLTLGQTLQFDFDGTNLDTSQPATINITVIGDTNSGGEYYDIFDENGVFITRIGETGSTCGPLNFTYTIPIADLTNYIADGTITFTAIPATGVGTFFCTVGTDEGVTIDFSYTPLSTEYLIIENDYTNGEMDASGFFPPGTTTVTYTVTDGCGNVSTCSTDVTVSPGSTTNFFDIITNADTICAGGMAELCLDIPSEVPDALYALDGFNSGFSDISRYILDTDNGTITPDNTFTGPDISDRGYSIDLNPVDNTVYLLSRLGVNNNRQLYTVDLTTSIISNIGQVISSTGNLQPQDMTFDNAGNLYATFNGGELHTINYTTSPITTNLVLTGLPSNGGVGLTYDFDNNRLLYSTGQGTNSLYEININTATFNLLTTFSTTNGCPGQGIEYIGNDIIIGSGTFGCSEIYQIDLTSNTVTSLLSPTGFYSSTKDLMFIPSIASGAVFWTDDMGNQIDTTTCIVVAPSNTTTYTASYTLPNGCSDVSQTTIYTTGSDLPPTALSVGICELENIINFNLTQYDAIIITGPNESVSWYIGQPSMGGTDITSTANDTDISANPDIWAEVFNSFTNCTQEVNLIYEIDNNPVITCLANITLNNDPDTCGAFVSIPLVTATDDNVTALPGSQNLRFDYIDPITSLQFDFDGANIDPNQAVTVIVTAVGNLDSSIEYYEIFDENNLSLTLLNGSFCTPNVFTYMIPAGDITTFLADNMLTFTATPSGSVFSNCVENYVEIELSYTTVVPQYVNITNDYNDGGADASGFYLPGTTTVTYVAADVCGNTDTCTVDITVIQEIVDGGEFNFTACGDLMNYDLTQLDPNFGGTMGTSTTGVTLSWYEGQPSMTGTDITPTADSTDMTGMPDIWVLISDDITGCLEEINLSYDFDFPPMITCPTNITVDVEPGTCGANVTIPLATATDDEVTPLPLDQTVLVEYTFNGQTLQFDFDGTNIDPSQPATLTISALADLGQSFEYFDIFDENGIFVGRIGNNNFGDCQPETITFTISVADLVSFLADNTISFFATATSDVDTFCTENQVEMNLSYTPLAVQYVTISNDYTNGGADASGYYTSGNTVVTYTATDGCGNMTTCTTTITVNQPPVTGAPYTTVFCGDVTMIDLTVINPELIVNPDDALIWFDGQPSTGGTDITANATAYDLSNMPNIWVQIGDAITGCLEDREIIYQLDTPPSLTCPADITVDALPGICGADVTIPPLVFTDDNIIPFPDDQTILLDYITDGQTLQFNFDGTNIDPSQPATLTIIVTADMGDPGETFDVFDENGNFIGQIGNNVFSDCQSETLTITISTADLTTFLADNIITFTTTATTAVNPFCGNDNVEMSLTYTPFSIQYVTVTNNYNNGGVDASDFYPSGTTTVTYTVTDGCGNTGTCSVDITVNQDPIPFTLTAESDTLCLGESTSLCVPDVLSGNGQLLGLNLNSPWLGDAFLVSDDLNTVSDDPNFVIPPILPPATSFGIYTALDYNPADGLYYILAENSSGGLNLYSVDIVTGATADFGTVSDNINLYALGMTFDSAGNLYLAIVSTLTSPFTTNIEVIPAAMLNNPVPTPTYLTTLPWDNVSGMTYNFDNNTIYYSTGSLQLYELDLSGNVLNGPIVFSNSFACDGQSIEYMGNGIIYGGTCGEIFALDPIAGTKEILANHAYDFYDLLFVPTTEFTWTDDAGNVVYVGNEICIDVSPDVTTTYTATYEADDCFYEGSITVNVFDPIANNPLLEFCDYEDISNIDLTIYDTEVNPDNALVEWYDGDPNDGGTLVATPTAIDLNTVEDLWALVTEGGCTASVDVTLLVYATQAVTLNDPADICEYEAPLSFSASPLPGTFTGDVAEYTSTASDGFTDNGDGTATLDPALAGTGTYDITYTYTNIYGCVTSQTVSVKIFEQPTAIANANSIICDGDDIMLSETGGDATAWTWTTDGTGVFEDANAQQTMVTGATDGETFTVSVTNDDGCVNSDQITVVFETLSTANDPMLVYCSDEDLTNINLTTYNTDVNAANNGETINWYDGNPEAGGTLISSPTSADLSAVNDLWAAVTDASGCTVVVDATITINAVPTITIDINLPCEGDDIILSEMGGDGIAWMWTTDGAATFDDATAQSPIISGASEDDTFTVTVTNDEGCTNTASATATFMALPSANDPILEYCEDEAVSVDLTLEDANVNPNASITWYDGNPNDGGTAIASPDNANLNTVNDLWALVTNSNDCTSTINISLNIITLPEIALNNPGNTCVNGHVLVFNVVPLMGTFTSTATDGFTDNNNGTASLNPTLAGPGLYDIIFTYIEEGCVREGTVSVEVYDTPAVSANANAICGDEPLQLSETGGDAVQWYWVSNGNAIFNSNTFQNPTVTNAADGERFTVYIEDENGCESNGQVVVSVGTPPTANDPNLSFCANDDISSINLDALSSEVSSSQNGEVVTWYDGEPNVGGTVISPPNSVDLNAVDDLWVSVAIGGCAIALDVTLTIHPAITLTPTVTPPDCNIANSGSIALGISGGTAPYNYTWSNGTESGNGTGDEINGIILGLYNITVTDANGCSESTFIEVQDESCFFTITNNFFASDPCTCNNDQTENGAGDGTFEETVTITGPNGIIIRASAASTGLDIPVPADFYESFPGRYRLEFNHVDRIGYVLYIEFSTDGGMTFSPATDMNGMQLTISNVCAYPVLQFSPPLIEFCEIEPAFPINAVEISPDVDFIPVEGYPAISINTGIQYPAPITFDPAGLGGSVYTFTAFYDYEPGTGMGGTLTAPAIALNACPTYIRINVPISQEPIGSAICGPASDPNEVIIDVDPYEDYLTPENLMYRVNGGPFQTSDKFIVNGEDIYNMTIMDAVTACSFDFQVNCLLVLPIELVFFNVHCDEDAYLLTWKTASESNVAEFVVERSANGETFAPIGNVAAVGESSTPQNYQYKDDTKAGRYYYRLRIVENDGKTMYSDVEVIECLQGTFDIVDVFPNPTEDELSILFESVNTDVINFKLTDILGRTIMEEDITPQIGLNTKVVDLTNLPSAMYFVVLNDGKIIRKVVRK